MRKYNKVIIFTALVWLVSLVIFYIYTDVCIQNCAANKTDTVLLNDIAKTAENNMTRLELLDNKDFDCEFVIVNDANTILYASLGDADKYGNMSVQTAIKNRYPYQYIVTNGSISGCVIMITDTAKEYNEIRNRLFAVLGILSLVFVVGAVIVITYFNRNIIEPFRQMRSFAGSIAGGNLDEPLLMDRNNVFGVFSESFDIMREELKSSRQREIELQRREREMVASLSHDLKTPVTGIKLSTELILAKLEREDDSKYEAERTDIIEKLNNVYKKADEIENLVSNLLSVSLNDLGEIKVNVHDEESSILEEILLRFDDCERVKANEVPSCVISVDVNAISRVIGNIISNSYKYAGTDINVKYDFVDNFLAMTIKDLGPGVSDDELPLITNKFYRGKAQLESNADGNGLGLYIARTLMEAMGGELLTESKGGFSVTLLIPLS